MEHAHLSLREASRRSGLSVRHLAYLIRRGHITPHVHDDRLTVPHEELKQYLATPRDVRAEHRVSYLKTLGPGLITGASDDDPSGIGTYSAVGSAYGLALSWLAVYLLPMMTATQETVARIGIVTGRGLAGALNERFGRRVMMPLVALTVFANVVNIGADIGAMAASARLLVRVPYAATAVVITLVMLGLEIFVPYHRYARILKWLTLSLLAYVVTAVIVKPDWLAVVRSLAIPHVELNTAFIAAMVAVMGTTITPYLFFWQASEEVEDERDKGVLDDHREAALRTEISEMRKDTLTGMAVANVVFLFIVITTAYVLHDHGITTVDSAQRAAEALAPLAGRFAAALFTAGIFGVGLLAVPVLAGASGYAVSELFGWREGLSERFTRARGFYVTIAVSMLAGLGIAVSGINPIRALYYAAIVNGIVAPVVMWFIFRLGRDAEVMGAHTNPRWVNVWGWIVTLLMGICAWALPVFALLGR